MEPQQYSSAPRSNLFIPLAIIIAGLVVAGAVFYTRGGNNQAANVQNALQGNPEDRMPAVSSSDHILGSPDAPIVLVEYSDTDCPYCQQFHITVKKVIDEYGKDGNVAWVYRHFAFHPKAPKEAEATECAAELGGNNAFWQYTDLLYSKKDFTVNPYKGLDPKELPNLALSLGLDKAKFSQCLDSGKYAQKVKAAYEEAVQSGAEGTPYTVIVTKNGRIPIKNGAIPYQNLKEAIDALLTQ